MVAVFRRIRWWWLPALAMLCVACRQPAPPATRADTPAPPTPLPLRTATIMVGQTPLIVEVADSEPARRRGLMFRDAVPEDRGMLFVFDDAEYRRFWMRNVPIPLSIAFIRPDGVICNILDMAPHEEHGNYWSSEKAQYALETAVGWFERHGVKAGDRVVLPDLVAPSPPTP